MPDDASALSRRLARDAEAVCRHYLSNGRRQGRYWLVGDVDNTPGGSLFVRLTGPDGGKGAAGKWTDAATGEHGDLLDLIALNRRIDSWRQVLDEARRYLSLPRPAPLRREPRPPARVGSPEAARRLWAITQPLTGTIAETYLRQRGLTDLRSCPDLRFHPRCWYRADARERPRHARDAWPALIAAVRDGDGALTGVNRTWLSPNGCGKAPVATPRRAIGHLLGHGVRFGPGADVMAAGEGIETMLSLQQVAPALSIISCLSANHLAALVLPPQLRRLYIVRDGDAAGRRAFASLAARAQAIAIETLPIDAIHGDLNDDLRHLGRDAFGAGMRVQFAPEDVGRFWQSRSVSMAVA